MPGSFNSKSDAAHQGSSTPRGLISDLMRSALEPKTGHDALARIKPALYVQRFPGTLFLQFGETAGVLAARAEAGAFHLAGLSAAYVANYQLHRPADSGVRPITLTEYVNSHVHADLMAN